MPPKGVINWGKPSVFLKGADEMERRIAEIVRENITISQGGFAWDGIKFAAPIHISFTLSDRKVLRFLQLIGLKKAPRCTYKTNMEYINSRRYNGHKRPKK